MTASLFEETRPAGTNKLPSLFYSLFPGKLQRLRCEAQRCSSCLMSACGFFASSRDGLASGGAQPFFGSDFSSRDETISKVRSQQAAGQSQTSKAQDPETALPAIDRASFLSPFA